MSEDRLRRKKLIHMLAVGFLAGAVWLVAVRFFTYQPSEVHYHANFAVFVDGERYPFDRFSFYEEIEACGGNGADSPKIRTHMHDNINHVVHVHDTGVTWGHFFANLGFANGDTVFRTDTDTFVENDNTHIRFMLNEEEVNTTANRLIENEDVLLVSIGNPSDEDMQSQYDMIQQDAAVYNENDDPSACSGNEELSFSQRLKRAIGIFND